MGSIRRLLLISGATVALSVAAITVSAAPPPTNSSTQGHAGKMADDLVRPVTSSLSGKQLDDLVRPGG
jgi:hypothetical protein